ncbi:MAG: TspO/MBR family protein [Candidatus Paceibacterota bacterium]
MNKKLSDFFVLVGFILFPLFIGFLSAFFAGTDFKEFYSIISKPAFAPPSWIFGWVWTVLYIMMGIAAFLAWQKKDSSIELEKRTKPAIAFYLLQLFLNYLWSIIFFGQRNYGLALIDIGLLWIVIILTVISFYKISKSAAWLLIPYLLWVSFAGVLNFMIWQLN